MFKIKFINSPHFSILRIKEKMQKPLTKRNKNIKLKYSQSEKSEVKEKQGIKKLLFVSCIVKYNQ